MLHNRPIAVGIPNCTRPQCESCSPQTNGEITLRTVHVTIVAIACGSQRLSLSPRVGELEIVLDDPQIADIQSQLAEVRSPRVLIIHILVGTRFGRTAIEQLRLVLIVDGIVLLRLHRDVLARRDALHLVAIDAHLPRAHLQHVISIIVLAIHALQVCTCLRRRSTSTADCAVRNAATAADDAAHAATRWGRALHLLHLASVGQAAHVCVVGIDATPLVARAIALERE